MAYHGIDIGFLWDYMVYIHQVVQKCHDLNPATLAGKRCRERGVSPSEMAGF